MKIKTLFVACLITVAGITMARADDVSAADVKMLAKAGMNDDVILSDIRNAHAVFHLSTAEIIDLKDSGVSQRVIDYMINTASSPAPAAVPPARCRSQRPPRHCTGPGYDSGSRSLRRRRRPGADGGNRPRHRFRLCLGRWLLDVASHPLGLGSLGMGGGLLGASARPGAVWIVGGWERHHGVMVWVDSHWR